MKYEFVLFTNRTPLPRLESSIIYVCVHACTHKHIHVMCVYAKFCLPWTRISALLLIMIDV